MDEDNTFIPVMHNTIGLNVRLASIHYPSQQTIGNHPGPASHGPVEFESLDFDEDAVNAIKTQHRAASISDQRHLWGYTGSTVIKISTTISSGILIGILAVVLQALTEVCIGLRNDMLQKLIENSEIYQIFAAQIVFSILCVVLAGALVQFIAPAAAGAGVSLVMVFLNGVAIQRLFTLKTLLVKFIGSFLARIAGLALGLEGPMVQMGACIGSLLCSAEDRIHCTWLGVNNKDTRRSAACDDIGNERKTTALFSNADHREIVSAGAAAGLAAAFGAPIGGVLFALEEASTVWSKKTAWRCFLCAATASFIQAQLRPGGETGMLNVGWTYPLSSMQWIALLPLLTIVSALGGLAGAAFNVFRQTLWRFRASRTRHALRLVEVAGVAVVTSIVLLSLSFTVGTCLPIPDTWTGSNTVQFYCDEGQYNDYATAVFGDANFVVKSLLGLGSDSEPINNRLCSLSTPCYFSPVTLAAVTISYLILMTLSTNLAVPGGIFMPPIMIGGALGALFGLALRDFLPASWDVHPGLFAVAAASACLGGVFRSSISLVVIMVEGTRGIEFLFAVILAVMVSNLIAHWVNAEGVYDSELERDGNVNYLRHEPPHSLRSQTAGDIMAAPVVTFNVVEPVESVKKVLALTKHNGFPVISTPSHNNNSSSRVSRLEGLISRTQLSVLLREKAYCNAQGQYVSVPPDEIDRYEHALDTLMDNSIVRGDGGSNHHDGNNNSNGEVHNRRSGGKPEEDGASMYINLAPFMLTSMMTVRPEMPAVRVHKLFVALSLRHLLVVDSANNCLGMITRKDIDRASGAGPWRVTRQAATPTSPLAMVMDGSLITPRSSVATNWLEAIAIPPSRLATVITERIAGSFSGRSRGGGGVHESLVNSRGGEESDDEVGGGRGGGDRDEGI
jgi:chloride channel 7